MQESISVLILSLAHAQLADETVKGYFNTKL